MQSNEFSSQYGTMFFFFEIKVACVRFVIFFTNKCVCVYNVFYKPGTVAENGDLEEFWDFLWRDRVISLSSSGN